MSRDLVGFVYNHILSGSLVHSWCSVTLMSKEEQVLTGCYTAIPLGRHGKGLAETS